jgi:hypothetical protein
MRPVTRHPAPTRWASFLRASGAGSGEILGEDYVGGIPDGGGDGATGLRGYKDLEGLRVGSEVG